MPSKPKPEKPVEQKPAKPAKPAPARSTRPDVTSVKIKKLTTVPGDEHLVEIVGKKLTGHIILVFASGDRVWGGVVDSGGPDDWTGKVTFPDARFRKRPGTEDVSVTVVNPTLGVPSKPKTAKAVQID